jgi:inosine-uridine nucleoside N-ribohydrolase
MTARRRVWIDTDPAITAGNGEVDDAFALIQALRSPELEIIGISAVFGNTDIDHSYAMAQEITKRAGCSDVSVYRGCGEAGDGVPNAATKALGVALADGPLTIAALGPLTNIAAALAHRDAALENVSEIIFVGGRRSGLEFRATPAQEEPFQDLNFELDPHAAATLLSLGVPITLAGWEVSARMWLTPADLDRLSAQGDACAQWLAQSARKWQAEWQRNFAAPGFTPFDTLAIGWMLAPELFRAHQWPAKVFFDGETPLFIADPKLSGCNATYLYGVDNDAFRENLMTRLLAA